LLRRAKRQQDLVIEVQKNLKSLTNIQKGIEKTAEQLRHLQSVVKDSQKQIIQVQRQVSTVERAQGKEFAKLRTQKRGKVVISTRGKATKNRERRKKTR
jgi:predicted  nucleic acid-binding Zn-ribbon protein